MNVLLQADPPAPQRVKVSCPRPFQPGQETFRDPGNEIENDSYKLAWIAPLPFWHNTVVIQQLGLVFGIALAFLFVVLLAADWPPDWERVLFDLQIMLIVTAIIFVLLVIALVIMFAGGYEMEYRLNDRGIGGRPYGRTAKKNAIVNFLLMISGRPTAMGAGMVILPRPAHKTRRAQR